METEQLCPEIMEIANTLLSNGFRVFRSAFRTYLFFATENNIGYVQYHSAEGYRWSTVHNPNCNCGTGFSFSGSYEDDEKILSIANRTAKALHHGRDVVKFKNVDEFLKYKNGPTPYLTELSLPL